MAARGVVGAGAGGVVYMQRGIGDNGDGGGDHILCRLRPPRSRRGCRDSQVTTRRGLDALQIRLKKLLISQLFFILAENRD